MLIQTKNVGMNTLIPAFLCTTPVLMRHHFIHHLKSVMFGRKAIISIELSYLKAGSELLGDYLALSNEEHDVSVTHCILNIIIPLVGFN